MTRPTQKQDEQRTLLELMAAIGVQLESCPMEGEVPDFMIQISDRTVGIEVTMYQSKRTVAGIQKRVVEAEWEELERSSQTFQNENSELAGIYILFRFKDGVPSRRERADFFCEILEFVRSNGCRIGDEWADFWCYELTSPLMIKYLKAIVLRRGERSEWDSNITAGFIDRPADTISRIVAEKSTRNYRPADELWLVIQRSHRPSEMVLPISGVSELDASLDLQRNLTASPFSKVYAFTAMGLFLWDRNGGAWLPAADAGLGQFAARNS
jgi:hypothetical protein